MFGYSAIRVTIVTGVMLVAATVMLWSPQGIAATVGKTQTMPELQRRVAQDSERSTQLRTGSILLCDRISLKDALVTELIAGRLTLREVTQRFAELNQELPECVRSIESRYPHLSGEELTAVNVLEYTEVVVTELACRDAVLCRLQAEFERTYGHRYDASH